MSEFTSLNFDLGPAMTQTVY